MVPATGWRGARRDELRRVTDDATALRAGAEQRVFDKRFAFAYHENEDLEAWPRCGTIYVRSRRRRTATIAPPTTWRAAGSPSTASRACGSWS